MIDLRAGLLALGALAAGPPGSVEAQAAGRPALANRGALTQAAPLFVENRGQFREDVRYRTLMPHAAATVTKDRLVLTQVREERDGLLVGHNISLEFSVGGGFAGHEPAPTRCSYLIGGDSRSWVREAPSWSSLRSAPDNSGAVVELHGRNGYLEYDFLLGPGVPAAAAEVTVTGARRLHPRPDGSLRIESPLGSITQLAPVAWEERLDGTRRSVPSRVVVLGDDRFGFAVEGRDASHRLVIDPGLVFGTFVDTDGSDSLLTQIAADANGGVYLGTQVFIDDFPVTAGAFQFEKTGRGTYADSIVAKLLPDGSGFEYSTYLGGNAGEQVRDMTVDTAGQVVVVGRTGSGDFPTTESAYSRTLIGDAHDGYVAKLNVSGSDLVFSSLFGGSSGGGEAIVGIAIDTQGRLVMSGAAELADLPTTPTAPQSTLTQLPGGFIVRMSPDASAVDYCTYIGSQVVEDVAVDASDAIYATGNAFSLSGTPATPGAFQEELVFGLDAFALKLDADGVLQWCSFLGGSGGDLGTHIEIDPICQLPVVAGTQTSWDFPSTPDVLLPFGGGGQDTFLTKFNADGSALVWSMEFGGSGAEGLEGFAVDAAGDIYVLTDTDSPDAPLTPNAFDSLLNDGTSSSTEAYVAKISADGSALLYGSYVGGDSGAISEPSDLAIDPHGNVYVTGYTGEADFPTTPGALDTELSGFTAMFVAKLDLSTWEDVGHALPQLDGLAPRLTAAGSLAPLSPGSIHVDQTVADASCFLIIGATPALAPLKLGTLVPAPVVLLLRTTNAEGGLDIAWPALPPGIPSGFELWFQAWIQDPLGPVGYTATNGLTATVP